MKKYIAEFIGTFALVFFGTGAIIVNSLSNGSLGLIGIAIVFGIVIMAMIYVFGSISGTHINPAVTIALVVGKQMPQKEAIMYLVSQITGALLASLLLYSIFPKTKILGETLPDGELLPSVVLEIILTFFLMLIILEIASKKEYSHLAGIVIGVLVSGIILIGGPISGGSFNPARSLAPAIVIGKFNYLWIYITAPVLGSILAVFFWRSINKIDE